MDNCEQEFRMTTCQRVFRATARLRVGTAFTAFSGTHCALRWRCNCTWHVCSLIMAHCRTCP
eukprot:5256579-Pleurochrysis_carterae.AAC.1